MEMNDRIGGENIGLYFKLIALITVELQPFVYILYTWM